MTTAAATARPSLDGARLKVERAREHLDALDAACRDYVDDSGALEFYGTREGAELIANVRVHSPPPPRLALIFGDAVHNLRCALDHLVRQLGIADTGKVSDKSAFPVVREEARWESAAGRTLSLLTPTHVAEIRRLQPFVGEGHGSVHGNNESPGIIIGALDVLDSRDKHRILLSVAAAAVGQAVSLSPSARRVRIATSHDGPVVLEGDTELFRLSAGAVPGGRLDVKAVSHVAIMFGIPIESTAWDLRAFMTTTTLRESADLVAGVIGSFEIDIRRVA